MLLADSCLYDDMNNVNMAEIYYYFTATMFEAFFEIL